MAFHRRIFLAGIICTSASLFISIITAASAEGDDVLSSKIIEIETRLDARVGATIIDTGTGRQWSHRADQRFPLTSTFKAFACAAVLARVDAGEEDLERPIIFQERDLVTYSPVTEKHVGGDGMTLAELCQATVATSDNTAGNLVIESLGGPAGFTSFMRSIGDEKSRLDRWETELNEAKPGDPRDTTTPAAAAKSLQDLVLGDILLPASRQQLQEWLIANEVGDALLRASLPEAWRIGDKTGAGGNGSRNIVAVIWPPERKPIIAAIYITETGASFDERNKAIAEIGDALVKVLTE